MDSVSGSLRDSEPTSPTSPGSPDPLTCRALRGFNTTSPSAITSALSTLTADPNRGTQATTYHLCNHLLPVASTLQAIYRLEALCIENRTQLNSAGLFNKRNLSKLKIINNLSCELFYVYCKNIL